jgi:cytochrome c
VVESVDNKVELKVAQFRKVRNRIIVVGYYVAEATPAQAQALLARAADALRADPDKALCAFNILLLSPYAEDDLYVFAIGLNDKRVRANGADPRLIGKDALSLRVPDGKPVQEMIAAAGQRDQQEMDYAWANPVTGKVQNKHIFLRQSRRHGGWRWLLRKMKVLNAVGVVPAVESVASSSKWASRSW